MMGIDYVGDPRSFLIHEGNRNSGRYPRGSGERPFQHVGRAFSKRKYQNPDGTLTQAGEERFAAEKRKNALKKKDSRVQDEENLRDPDKWIQDDVEAMKDTSESAEKLVRTIGDVSEKLAPKPKQRRFDLSSMTDDELRKRINRMQMEEQYTRLVNEREPSPVSRGRQFLSNALSIAGSTLAVSTSALTLALAIKKLGV